MATKLSGATCIYTLGATLGVGEYGKAIQCKRDNDDAQVVVKQVHISALSSQEQADAINEVRVMQELDHLNIVKYIECMRQDGYLYIVMEYCCYGELSGLIANREKAHKPFTEQEIMFWFVQIALGLWHVHSKNILHRDLKTQNIFVSKGGILKLGDFGISRVLNSDTELAKTAIGTPYYLSPEICQDMPYNRKSDVWALGCVLYELATLRRAFTGGSLPALVVKILKGQYPPLPARYSSQLKTLVASLLQQDPRVRPSIDAVLRLDYVKSHLARYAQHVVRLTTGPSEPSITSKGLSTTGSEVERHATSAAAVAEETQPELHNTLPQTEAGTAVSEGPSEAATNKQPASKKSSSSRLRVPLPGFLRKKAPQDEQQLQQPSPPAAELQAAAAQQGQQSSSFAERIRRSLSRSSGSASSMKGPSQRNSSNGSEAAHEDRSQSELGQSQGSSTGQASHSNSLSNSFNNSAGSSSNPNLSQQPPHTELSAAGASDVDGGDVSGYDSSSPPSPTDDSRGQRRQRKKLIGTSWIEQQQLALARLQADLAASPAVRGKSQGPQHPATEADRGGLPSQVAAGSAPAAANIVKQVLTPVQQPLRAAVLATPSPQVLGKAAGSAVVKPLPSSNSKASGKKAGSKGSRGGGLSSSPADVVAAARKARLAERASWQEQQARAAADDAVHRAARTAELATALREKSEAAHNAEEAGHALVAAHRQHLKAVQPRVNKSQLAELGAAFRQRLEVQGDPTAAAVTAEGGYQLQDVSAVPIGVKILQQTAGGSALLLDLSEAGFGPVTPQADSNTKGGPASSVKLQSRPSDSRPSNAAASAPPARRLRSAGSNKQIRVAANHGGGSCSRSSSMNNRGTHAAASKQGSRRTSAEGESTPVSRVKSAGRAGLQVQQPASKICPAAASAVADKPWRIGKHIGLQRGAEPAIEIFAPYGSDCALDQPEQHSLQQPDNVPEFTLASQIQRTLNAPSSLLVNDSQLSLQAADNGATSPTSPQVVNVLHTIQAALRQRPCTQASSAGPAVADGHSGRPDSGTDRAQTAAGETKVDRVSEADSLELPPEASPVSDQLPSTAVRGWGAAAELNGTTAVPVAQKIEALRFSLQQSLGADAFMLAYRYMSAMHASVEDDGEDGGSFEVLLFELLGPEKVHFVHLIHKLLMLENQAYEK